MSSLIGFKEKFGNELVKEDFVKRSLMDTAYLFGYEQIVVPTLEKASSFSEAVVGHSPWPEWNQNGCFYLDVPNYENDYEKVTSVDKALLVPEGTVSVTRWLGDLLSSGKVTFPIKLFYTLNCFRNELLCKLNELKRREFEQFGMEILGTSAIHSDVEILYLVCVCLMNLHVAKESIRIRLNNVAIFNLLSQKSKLSIQDITILKEKFDYLAESKAGKHPEKKDETIYEILSILHKYTLDKTLEKEWKFIIHSDYNPSQAEYSVFTADLLQYFEDLQKIKSAFARLGICVDIDLCVIRSHEYYTGISFEVDVVTQDKLYFEIAGGGRYDRLVGKFITNKSVDCIIVPCTGFAFGLERVVALLNDQKIFDEHRSLHSDFHFEKIHDGTYDEAQSIDQFLLELTKK